MNFWIPTQHSYSRSVHIIHKKLCHSKFKWGFKSMISHSISCFNFEYKFNSVTRCVTCSQLEVCNHSWDLWPAAQVDGAPLPSFSEFCILWCLTACLHCYRWAQGRVTFNTKSTTLTHRVFPTYQVCPMIICYRETPTHYLLYYWNRNPNSMQWLLKCKLRKLQLKNNS